MKTVDAEPRHVLVTLASRQPSAAEVKTLLSRLFVGGVPDAAVDQLVALVSVANRWLTDHPEAAVGLIDEPAVVLHAMQKAGVLTGSVDDLLALLRSLRREGEGTLTPRQRLARVLRPKTATFGPKPSLRFTPNDYGQGD